MEHPCPTLGPSIEIRELPIGYPLATTRGLSIGHSCATLGLPMGYPRATLGLPMGCPSAIYVLPKGYSWGIHG